MTRQEIIKNRKNTVSKLNSKLKNIKNYKSIEYLLKDVSKLEKALKEVQIQECYIKYER